MRPPVIWMGKNEYGRVEIWWTGCAGKKMKEQQNFQNHRYCTMYALKVSVNGVICVFSGLQAQFESL